jgi:opacity protein-like surface antigen
MNKIFLLILLFAFCNAFSYENDDTNWEYFKKNFYGKPAYVVNHPVVKLNFGLDNPATNRLPSIVDFKNTYSFNFHYGFLRLDDEIEELTDIFKHSSEFTFLENTSSTFKNFDNPSIGTNTDTWGFGFGLEDGFGIRYGDERLYLLHTTGFSWTHIDFDIVDVENDERFISLKPFDEKIKFGTFYSGGLRYEFIKRVAIDLRYRKNLIQSDFILDSWFYSYIFDNITQRWIDYFEPDFIQIFGKNYIWMKFVYKNALSFLIYQMRENNAHYPFNGKNTFYYDSFKIGLVFYFY